MHILDNHTPYVPVVDLYSAPHKGLRLGLSELLCKLGNLNVERTCEVDAVAERVEEILDLVGLHIAHEEEFLHPAIRAKLPELAQRLEREHHHHAVASDALRNRAEQLVQAMPGQRQALARALYHEFSAFVGENLEHMLQEETEIQPALDLHYSAAELQALEAELVGSIPPAEMMRFLSLMLPAMNPSERVVLLQGPQQGMPPEAFQEFLDQLAPVLTSTDYDALKRDLAA
ncbi:MAG: hemerythrin domain-containing protein [Polyangiaceae bacterium]|nr:hemerythrin domain-containing protein [Polyangiaceae bacterium]MCB9607110.1 hemerythrin domain-containing protein [Polyangiaceae bacterium]